MEKSISHTLCMSYVKLTVRQESLIRCSNKGDYQLFCHGRNDWETKFERSWTAVLKNAKHATVQLHTLGIGDANYKRDGKWAYNRRNNIYSTRTRANASRVSNGELERNERQGCLSGWLNFRRQPKDRFCGIIFNEPWSHFQEKERERERKKERETLSEFGQWWMQFRARVSTCFYQQDRAAGLFAGWCIIMDSRALPPGHSRLILNRFPSSSIGRQPPPYLVTSCASVCVRARVHGPTNLLFFFFFVFCFFLSPLRGELT